MGFIAWIGQLGVLVHLACISTHGMGVHGLGDLFGQAEWDGGFPIEGGVHFLPCKTGCMIFGFWW